MSYAGRGALGQYADPWTQRKAAEARMALLRTGAGAVEAPPPRPMNWPLIVGWGAVLVAAAGIFWATTNQPKRVSANRRRRRRVRRNPGYELVYSTGGHGGPYHSLEEARDGAERLLRGGRDAWIAVVPRSQLSNLRAARPSGVLYRQGGWQDRSWLPNIPAHLRENGRRRRVSRNGRQHQWPFPKTAPGPGTRGWYRFDGMYVAGLFMWDGSHPRAKGDLFKDSERIASQVALDEANAIIAKRYYSDLKENRRRSSRRRVSKNKGAREAWMASTPIRFIEMTSSGPLRDRVLEESSHTIEWEKWPDLPKPRVSDRGREALTRLARQVEREYRLPHGSVRVEVKRGRGRKWLRPNGLTKAKRRRMSRKSFVFPARRAWPLDSQKRAKAAISYMHMGRVGTKSDYLAIRNEIIRRYGMGFWRDAGGPSWEKIARAKTKRTRSRRRRTTRRVAANRGRKKRRRMTANHRRDPRLPDYEGGIRRIMAGKGGAPPWRAPVVFAVTWRNEHGVEIEAMIYTNRTHQKWWYREGVVNSHRDSNRDATTSIRTAQKWADGMAAMAGVAAPQVMKGRKRYEV